MDLCAGIVFFVFFLIVWALIGHGIWVMMAALGRALFGQPNILPRATEPIQRPGRRTCLGCGCGFSRQVPACPQCGLDPMGPVAEELRDLEFTVQYLQRLVDQGTLEPAAGEQVYRGLEARQQTLLHTPARSRPDEEEAPAIALTPHYRQETSSARLLQRLEDLLTITPDVRDLSLANRQLALSWYKTIPDDSLCHLPAQALLGLARLTRLAGLSSRSLRVAEILLETFPQAGQVSAAALEAIPVALREGKQRLARWFLERLQERPLAPEERDQVNALVPEVYRHVDAPPAVASPLAPMAGVPIPVAVAIEEEPIVPPPLAETPGRTWGQLLAGFMEEKNILWGELVGGLLIVGCSIALVISLWQTLETIPYFPFLIFAAITAGLFAAGLYTLSHWKLEATSRGLLVIATLLTPLDFLVLTGLWRGVEAGVFDWALEIGAVGFFAWLVQRSGRVLVQSLIVGWRRSDWFLALGVVGVSAFQLLALRWLEAHGPTGWRFLLLSYGPVVCFAAAVALALGAWRAETPQGNRQVEAAFLFLGQTFFALGVTLGFVLYASSVLGRALHGLAGPVSLAGIPLLACGALVQQRLGKDSALASVDQPGLPLGLARWLGSVLALVGTLIMTGGLALAWPDVSALVILGLVNAVVLMIFALRLGLAYAQAPALLCLSLAVVAGYHGVTTTAPEVDGGLWLWERFRAPSTGTPLTLLALFMAVFSEGLWRAGRRLDAIIHLVACGAAAALALALVGQSAYAQPARATPVYAILGLTTLLVNARWRRAEATYAGGVSLLLALVFGFEWFAAELPPAQTWVYILLSFATLAALAGWGLTLQPAGYEQSHGQPLLHLAFIATLLVLGPFLLALDWPWLPMATTCAAWLAGLWLTLAWILRWRELATAAQAVLIGAVGLATSWWLGEQHWVQRQVSALMHPWSLQAYGLCLAVFCLLSQVGRRTLQRLGFLPESAAQAFSLDCGLLELLLVGSIVLLVPSLAQGVYDELTPPGVEALGATQLLPELAWSLSGVLAVALVLALWGRQAPWAIVGLVLVTLGAILIGCASFHEEKAVASALRWGLALGFLGLSGLIWLRAPLTRLGGALRITTPWPEDLAGRCRRLLVAGAFTPVLGLTIWVILLRAAGWRPAGPVAESLFAQMGSLPSRIIPVAFLAVGLLGYAWRDKLAGYFFATGLLLVALVSAGRALIVLRLDETEGVFLVQLGLAAWGMWSLAWLASGRWRQGLFLPVQLVLGFAASCVAVAPALWEIVVDPGAALSSPGQQVGHWAGFLGFLANTLAGVWFLRQMIPRLAIHLVAAGGIGLGVLLAMAATGGNTSAWAGFHGLTVAWTALALILLSASWLGDANSALGPRFWTTERRAALAGNVQSWFPVTATRRWVEVLALVVVTLAFTGLWQAPDRPLWSLGTVLATSALFGALAVWARKPGYVYASGLLLNLLAYLIWQAWFAAELGLLVWWPFNATFFQRFLLLEIIALGLGATAWSIIDHRLRGLTAPIDVRGASVPYPHAATLLAVHLLAVLILAVVLSALFAMNPSVSQPLTWLAWAATAVAVLSTLWDAEATLWGLPGTPAFLLGLLAIGLALHDAGWSGVGLAQALMIGVAGYLGLTAVAVRFRDWWQAWASRLRVPSRAAAREQFWFVPSQVLLGVVIVVASLAISLSDVPLLQRFIAPVAVSLLALTALALAGAWSPLMADFPWRSLRREKTPRNMALWLILIAVAESAWAGLGPDWSALWLHRAVALLAVLVLATGVYGTGLFGRLPADTEWGYRLRRMARPLALASCVQLAVVLVLEFSWYDPLTRRTPLTWPEVALVAALLILALVGCLWLAVTARLTRSGWSEQQRSRLVYAAEALVVLLMIHLRLSLPDFFGGHIAQYWTLLVMVLAFAGVGLAEWCRRRGLTVLARPLEQTSLFIPLLPLAAYLARPLADLHSLENQLPGLQPFFRGLRGLPADFLLHATLWFLVGGLYTWVAVLRRSTTWALLAALAANFGLWVILAHQEGLGMLLHPQLWLAPLGLILLAAEHLHRDQLTANQSRSIRYLGLLVIYLSSTADMFITGLGQSLWLPLVLAVLAIAGVFAGIMLRVRAFLVLGMAFLFLVIFAQIWHAAVDRAQTWLWWVCGIILGVAILVLFALFEKRRNDIAKMLEELKRWR